MITNSELAREDARRDLINKKAVEVRKVLKGMSISMAEAILFAAKDMIKAKAKV